MLGIHQKGSLAMRQVLIARANYCVVTPCTGTFWQIRGSLPESVTSSRGSSSLTPCSFSFPVLMKARKIHAKWKEKFFPLVNQRLTVLHQAHCGCTALPSAGNGSYLAAEALPFRRFPHRLWGKMEPRFLPCKLYPLDWKQNAMSGTAICSGCSAHRRFQEWMEAGVFEAFGMTGFRSAS